MKKIILIISLFVLIISIFLIKMQAVSYSPEKVLLEAFGSSGAGMVSSEMYLRAEIRGAEKPDIELCRHLMGDVLRSQGADVPESDYKIVDTDSSEGLEMDLDLGNGRRIHAGIVNGKGGDSGGCYISISLVDTSKTPDLAGARAAFEKALNPHGIRPKFNSCITGSFDGRTGNSELNKVCARIFASAHARKVEGVREGGLISVSALSNAIRASVDDNGSKVNLNLAVRYNSYEKKTYLWLATPVITTEY